MMLRSIIVPAVALTLGSNASPPAAVHWDAVQRVTCGIAMGTAFHIGSGRWITADHVLGMGGRRCVISGEKAPVEGENPTLDIAELGGPVIADKLELDCTGFHKGRDYLATGYAEGESLFRLPMLYSAFGRDPDNGNGQFIGPEVIPGMSGGPVFTDDWRVAGVVLQRWPARARALADTYLCGGGA